MSGTSALSLMRSVLYVPGGNIRAIEKAPTLDADVIIFDLEDSVADDAKQSARNNLVDVFSSENLSGCATVIRINAIDSTSYSEDLATVSKCSPGAVLLPKVSTVSDVETLERDAISNGISSTVKSWFMIETAAGIINLPYLISAGQASRFNLECLVVGHNDLARETGVSLANNRQYLVPWLMQIILHGKGNGLETLDSVWNNFKDTDGFLAESGQAKQMGFSGKTLIHPSQVSLANTSFSPSEAEMVEARAIVAAYGLPENASAGVINLHGEMVERLHLEQAQQLLAKYG